MNHIPGLLGATARGARWGLPWLCALAISTSVAYAIIVGVAHAPFNSNASTTVAAVHAPGQALRTTEAETTPAAIDRVGSSEVCDTTAGRMLYVGLNSWVPAETGAARCPEGIP
jgi:hypothetical protein